MITFCGGLAGARMMHVALALTTWYQTRHVGKSDKESSLVFIGSACQFVEPGIRKGSVTEESYLKESRSQSHFVSSCLEQRSDSCHGAFHSLGPESLYDAFRCLSVWSFAAPQSPQ